MNIKNIIFLILVMGNTWIIPRSPFAINYIFPEDMHGWFGPANAQCLEEFIKKISPKKVVEIGSWLGVSAIFMAKRLDANAKLYCVDPWVPYHDMANSPECQERLKNAYERFLSNCIHHKVTDKIIPLRMTSMQAVEEFSKDVDLIYIDGSHKEEDVYNDITHWYQKLSPDGIMCGDDICWPSVHAAIVRAASLLNLRVEQKGNFWWFEKRSNSNS